MPIPEDTAAGGFAPERLPRIVHARKRYLAQLTTLVRNQVRWCIPVFWTSAWPPGTIPMPGLVAGLALSATGAVMLPEVDDANADDVEDPFDDARHQLHRTVRAVTRLLALAPAEQRTRLGPTCLVCDMSRMFLAVMRNIGPFLQVDLPRDEWAAIEAVSASINALPNDPRCQHPDALLDTAEVEMVRANARRMVQTFGWPATPPPPVGSVEGGGWAWSFD